MCSANEDYSKSFAPIIGKEPLVLILGTMPGKESIRLKEYYGHPRNIFWKILSSVIGLDLNADYSSKAKALIDNKIAVWDVCYSCYRKGSLDSNIKEVVPNKISELIHKYPSIQRILFNGKKAEKEYLKYFSKIDIDIFSVPSSSPANTSMNYDTKLDLWRNALHIC